MTMKSDTKFGTICYGIDIGGTAIKAGIFDMSKKLCRRFEFPTNRKDNGGHILQDIADFVAAQNVRLGYKAQDIAGIGLGVPGSVMADGTVNKCVNLGWGVINSGKILSEMTGIPVYTGNDANMAALGEYCEAEEKAGSMIFITLGTGVGGGIIIDGKPITGANGAAAEIGHIPIVHDETEECTCGKKGCLEQAASADGVVRTAVRILKEYGNTSSLKSYDVLSAKIIFDEAKKGDKAALQTVDTVADYLGKGLACAACIADPGLIVIGGGMSAAGEFLLERIRQSYRMNVFHPCKDTPITAAKLGNDAGMYGAAQLVINSCS